MINKLIRTGFMGGMVGIVIGLIISVVMSFIYGEGNYYPSTPIFMENFSRQVDAMVVSVVIWFTIGCVNSAASWVFEHSEWSITKMTVTHFIIVYSSTSVIGYFAGWFSFSFNEFLIYTVIFIVIYVIIWFLNMQNARKSIKELNRYL